MVVLGHADTEELAAGHGSTLSGSLALTLHSATTLWLLVLYFGSVNRTLPPLVLPTFSVVAV